MSELEVEKAFSWLGLLVIILAWGEKYTGKELLARTIHAYGWY